MKNSLSWSSLTCLDYFILFYFWFELRAWSLLGRWSSSELFETICFFIVHLSLGLYDLHSPGCASPFSHPLIPQFLHTCPLLSAIKPKRSSSSVQVTEHWTPPTLYLEILIWAINQDTFPGGCFVPSTQAVSWKLCFICSASRSEWVSVWKECSCPCQDLVPTNLYWMVAC
jgi:hypothetical protein